MDQTKAVAVVGIGCRFPGANSPEELWQVLINKENHVKEVPKQRWNTDYYYSSDRNAPGKTYSKHAGLIDHLFMWDHKFFGVNRMEAEVMDPQHKLAMEVSYRALEDGGFALEDIRGSNTAVYMGTMTTDHVGLTGLDPEFVNVYTATGTVGSILSNRLSYFYDIHGPSVTVDTACSSGLVTVHQGMKSILAGESDMAICGGTGCILSPFSFITLCKAGMASESGQCRTFTDEADGYVRSEGCGVVILKDIDKAQRDGDKIYCILTCCSNSDGKATTPMTAPSSQIQAQLIQATLSRARLQPQHIQFVEMHGTGTPAGDPAEVASLGSVMAGSRDTLCPVGSIKTNLGHLEAAAGIAGLIKVILMMEHGHLVPSVLFGKIKDSLNLEENSLYVLENNKNWDPIMLCEKEVRIASVNAFGFGGTNVHIIAQQFTQSVGTLPKHTDKLYQYVVFAGTNNETIKQSMTETYNFLENSENAMKRSLNDLAHTSYNRRTLFKKGVNRVIIPATSLENLKDNLKQKIQGKTVLNEEGKKAFKQCNHVIVVFCGMGTNWNGMGITLYNTEPVFKKSIDNLQAVFHSFTEFNLLDCLEGKYDLVNPVYAQPSLFSCQVALFDLWVSQGVVPDLVMGHSVGEVAAAYASGGLSLESAAFVVYHRSLAVGKAPKGSMLAVGHILTEIVQNEIQALGVNVDVAAFNSKDSCTLSGDDDAISQIHAYLESMKPKPFIRKLEVNRAFHSYHMDTILPEFKQSLSSRILEENPEWSLCQRSTVYNKIISKKELCDVDYWATNVRKSVRFHSSFKEALSQKPETKNVVVEIGPKPALKRYITDITADRGLEHCYLPSMTENKESTFYESVSKAYQFGIVRRSTSSGSLTPVPRLVFDKQFVYKESEHSSNFRRGIERGLAKGHPFVSAKMLENSEATSFKCTISQQGSPFVYDHKMNDGIVLPGAIYVEMALAALHFTTYSTFVPSFQTPIAVEISFKETCHIVGENHETSLSIGLKPDGMDCTQFRFDITNGETLHAIGAAQILTNQIQGQREISRTDNHGDDTISRETLYNQLEAFNFKYGPSLKSVTKITAKSRPQNALIELDLPPNTDVANTIIPPPALDGVLQSGVVFIPHLGDLGDRQVMPYGVQRVIVYSKCVQYMIVHMTLAEVGQSSLKVDAKAYDSHGFLIFECIHITYGIHGEHLNFKASQSCLMQSWEETPIPNVDKNEALEGRVLVLIDSESTLSMQNVDKNCTLLTFCTQIINDILQDEKALEKMLPPNIAEYVAIFCCVGLHVECKRFESINGTEMNSFVSRANMFLIQLLKLSSNTSFTDQFPPVYVITRGVYSLIHAQKVHSQQELNAVLGTTITAMCRSVFKELPSMHLHTLDLEDINEDDISLLWKIIKDQPRKIKEFAIFQGRILSGTMVSVPQMTDHIARQTTGAKNDPFNVCVKGNENRLCLKRLTDTTVVRCDSSQTSITLEQAHIIVKNASSNDQFITATDSVGLDDEGNRYHICQLQEVSSVIHVNTSCMLKYDSFPCKYPVFSYWLLAWNIMRKVLKSAQESKYHLVISESSFLWEYAAEAMATLMGLKREYELREGTPVILITRRFSTSILQTFDEHNSLFVLSENCTTDHSLKSNYQVQYLGYCISNMLPFQISKLIAKFQKWSDEQNQRDVVHAINNFESAIDHQRDVVNVDELPRNLNYSNNTPTFLQMSSTESAKKQHRPLCIHAHTPKQMIQRDAGYLVIGGRKGLSWETIKYLIGNGAKYIGVISRSASPEEKVTEGARLERENGCTIIDLQADTSSYNQLGQAINLFEKQTGVNIKGIFYGAAVTEDSILIEMSVDKFNAALIPKVAGAWNVYTVSRHMQLDFLIFYSSMTSMFGNPGQTNYGAGNGFEDAISCFSRTERDGVQSVCFGPMDVGIVANNDVIQKRLISLGFDTLKVPEITACIDDALMQNRPLSGYCKFNWPKWYRSIVNLEHVLHQYQTLIDTHCHYFRSKTKAVKNFKDSDSKTDDYIVQVVKEVARLYDDDLDTVATLSELGADSQDRQQIYNALREQFQFNPAQLNVLELGQMTLGDFVQKVNDIVPRL